MTCYQKNSNKTLSLSKKVYRNLKCPREHGGMHKSLFCVTTSRRTLAYDSSTPAWSEHNPKVPGELSKSVETHFLQWLFLYFLCICQDEQNWFLSAVKWSKMSEGVVGVGVVESLFHTFNSCNKNKRLDHWLSAPGEVYVSKIALHTHNEADWKQC